MGRQPSQAGWSVEHPSGTGSKKSGSVASPCDEDGFLERRFGDEDAACDSDEADGLFTKISGYHEEVKIRTIQVKNTFSNRLCSPLVQRIVDTACPRSFCPPWLIGV